jgi:hypothetical protein
MFENYLIHPQAISYVLDTYEFPRRKTLDGTAIEGWIRQQVSAGKHGQVSDDLEAALTELDGARLLADLFDSLSEHTVQYDKVRDGVALTEWLLANEPERLVELRDVLKDALTRGASE